VSPLPATRTWTVDARHSRVGFRVKHHAVAIFRSGFGDFEGRYEATTGSLTGSARVDSVQTFDGLRSRMLEPDVFDAERHPTISFVSTSTRANGSGVTVEGDLTMRGVTRPVVATGTVSGTSRVRRYDGSVNDHFGLDLELTIDRREFGLDWNNELLDGRLNLGWDVTLELSLELSAPAEEDDGAARGE